MPKKPYNGHESWNAWNVALWIYNDEGLYNAALECIRRPRVSGKPVTPSLAAGRFIVEAVGPGARTPDGARYSHRSVMLAMRALMED
ncbi:MAG: hypothetical protein AB7R40_23270 [Nitrospiraceae bacterium]